MRDSANREVELKLRVPPHQLAPLRKSPLLTRFSPRRPRAKPLYSVYFDTADRRLWRAGLTLRVRQAGNGFVQTVKTRSRTAGHRDIGEWEAPIGDMTPEPGAIPEPALAARVKRLLGRAKLRPVFESDIRRMVRRLTTEAGDEVEMAIDVGELRAGERSEAVCEMELELVRGRPNALYEIAGEFIDAFGLVLEPRAKAERGRYLALGEKPPAVKAQKPVFDPDASLGEVVRAVLESCLAQILANEGAVREGERVEGVHQMRVGLRRLRAALTAFRPVLAGSDLLLLANDARWLAGELGAQRDLDVFAGDLLAPVAAAFPDDAGLELLADRLARRQGEARRVVEAALTSKRYGEFVFDLAAGLNTRQWQGTALKAQGGLPLEAPARCYARRVLDKRARKVRRYGKRLDTLSIAERHEMRKELKKLRYCVEFFAPLFPGKTARRYLASLARLQDIFGHLNDVAMSRDVLEDLLTVRAPDTEPPTRRENRSAGLVLGWHTHASVEAWTRARARWRRLEARKPFWRAQ